MASRRGGPAKEPLSRDAIVTEALRQLGAEGPKGMSLRKVAAALDTGPASLYAYVEDLEELHALVLDRALAQVDLGVGSRASWRKRLVRVLESYATVLSASPGLAKLAFGTVAVGANALRITERILELLHEGGVEISTAAWAVDLLLLYVTATAAEHADGLEPAADGGAVARAIAAASEHEYPHVGAARTHLLSGTPQGRFAWAIDTMLGGILQKSSEPRSAPATAAPTRKPARKSR